MVVEDFTVESGKTRELVKILKGLTPENRTAIVISGEDSMLKRAGRNVPGLSILSYNRLRAHDLFYAGRVIVFEKAAEELGRMYGEPSSKRRAGKPPAVTKALGGAKPVTLEKPKAAGAGSKPAAKAKVTTDKPKAAAKPKTEAAAKAPAAKAPSKSVKAATAGSKPAAKKPAAKTEGKPKATAQAKAATAGSKAAAKKPAAKKPDGRSTPSTPASRQKPAAPTKAAPKKAAPKAGAPKAAPEGSKPSAKKSGTGKTSKEDT